MDNLHQVVLAGDIKQIGPFTTFTGREEEWNNFGQIPILEKLKSEHTLSNNHFTKLRLGVDLPCGVLDLKESVLIAVSSDSFDFASEGTQNDRITVEWTNTPEDAAKQFRREWFQGDGIVRGKNLPIEYNP